MPEAHELRRVSDGETPDYPRPAFEVISLDCEITAYAPDDGGPLF